MPLGRGSLLAQVLVVDELVAVVAQQVGRRFLHSQADDVLAQLLELGHQRREIAVAGQDREGVDVLLGIGKVDGIDAQADVGRVLAASRARRGISINSMAALCKGAVYGWNRLQSAYAFLATILPFSTKRSRTRWMSKRSRRFWKPSARFSKSMKMARGMFAVCHRGYLCRLSVFRAGLSHSGL